MSLNESLDSLKAAASTAQAITSTPKGWEAGIKFEPNGSRLITLPAGPELGDESTWAAAVQALGVSVPDGFRIRLVEAKFDPVAWTRDDADQANAVTRAVWRYRFVVEVAPAQIPIDDLLKAVRKRKPAKAKDAPESFVFVMGDLQLGKPDGDGSAGTVQRFYDSLDRALTRYKYLRKAGMVDKVCLSFVGDCPEGTQSQGGNLVGRLDLTLTEQIRVLRRIFADEVTAFGDLASEVLVCAVPGNHGDVLRVGNQVATNYDDNWDIESLVQVADVCQAKGYDNLKWMFPGHDEMHLVADVSGTRIGMLHGHQVRGKMQPWLANKAMDRDAIGTSDVVVAGHFHHLHIQQFGPTTFMQTGALDGGSVWWQHKGGLTAPPAALTFVTSGGVWHDLQVV